MTAEASRTRRPDRAQVRPDGLVVTANMRNRPGPVRPTNNPASTYPQFRPKTAATARLAEISRLGVDNRRP